ncbi:phosphatase PAP2 family protein [Candidatus Nomurabacteria bacterium]|nr:phosphatase PAP2 family protein [Candidatus Nomurabacteria bacterium]
MNNIIFNFLYGFAHHFKYVDDIVFFCAIYLPYLIVIFAISFLLLHHDIISSKFYLKKISSKGVEIMIAFFSGFVAWISASVLKVFFHTPRPFVDLFNVYPLFYEKGFAFPSGHATFFMALAMAILFNHKKVGIIFIFLALIVGIARIIAGVHYPIDILGGFILGSLISIFFYSIRKII